MTFEHSRTGGQNPLSDHERLAFVLEEFHDAITSSTGHSQLPGELHEGIEGISGRARRAQDVLAWIEALRRGQQGSFSQGSGTKRASRLEGQASFGDGRFTIQHCIGEGAMGRVFEAFDDLRLEFVAAKELTRVDPLSLYFFKHEFRLLEGLVHPNLVRLHDLIFWDGSWILTMELVKGQHLMDYIVGQQSSSDRPRGHNDALLLPSQFGRCGDSMTQLVKGLQYLHRSGRVHRDVKPGNVMVCEDGRVVLLDMGLVRDCSPLAGHLHPKEREIVGTPGYMSPEQSLAELVGPESDMYSVGVILYELLTGKRPFRHVAYDERLDECKNELIFPSHIPSDLQMLCRGLLQSEPHLRPSGDDLLQYFSHGLSARSQKRKTGVTESRSSREGLVGRKEDLSVLQKAWQVARKGGISLVKITGASGVGKTALVEAFVGTVSDDAKCVVLASKCHEREFVPFKAVDGLIDSLSRTLSYWDTEEAAEIIPVGGLASAEQLFPVLGVIRGAQLRSEQAAPQRDPRAAKINAVESLRQLIARLASRRVILLFLDDLQWADSESVELLGDLFFGASSSSICAIFTEREAMANSGRWAMTLEELVMRHAPTVVRFSRRLESLSTEECLSLARLMAGPELSEWKRLMLAKESRGNPYYLSALVSANVTDRFVSDLLATNVSVADSLAKLIEEQRKALSPSADLVLMIVCLSEARIAVLDAVAAAQVTSIAADIDSLVVMRLVSRIADGGEEWVEPWHDQVREAVASELSLVQKTSLHQRLAQSLQSSRRGTFEQLAFHYSMASQPALACRYLILAADQASGAFAFAHAAKLYAGAVRLLLESSDIVYEDPVSTARSEYTVPPLWSLLAKRAESLGNAGHGRSAAEVFLEARKLAPAAEKLQLSRKAALQFCVSGHVDRGRAMFEEILIADRVPLPRHTLLLIGLIVKQRIWEWLARLRGSRVSRSENESLLTTQFENVWLAISGLLFFEPVAVATLSSYCLNLASRIGRRPLLLKAYSLEAIMAASRGEQGRSRSEAMLCLARSVYDGVDNGAKQTMLPLAEGVVAFLQVRMADAVDKLVDAEKELLDGPTRSWWELDLARTLISWACMHMGHYDELDRLISTYVRDAESQGDRTLLASLGTAGIPQLKLREDNPLGARSELTQVKKRFPSEVTQQQHVSVLYSQAQIDLYEGNACDSWRSLVDVWPKLRSSLQLQNQFARVSLLDLRGRCGLLAGTASGSREQILSARRDLARLRREKGEWVKGYVSRLEAGLHWFDGNSRAGAKSAKCAAVAFERIGFRLCAAAMLVDFGRIHGGKEGDAAVDEGQRAMADAAIRNQDRFQLVLGMPLRQDHLQAK